MPFTFEHGTGGGFVGADSSSNPQASDDLPSIIDLGGDIALERMAQPLEVAGLETTV
jgi:hypothetical protein